MLLLLKEPCWSLLIQHKACSVLGKWIPYIWLVCSVVQWNTAHKFTVVVSLELISILLLNDYHLYIVTAFDWQSSEAYHSSEYPISTKNGISTDKWCPIVWEGKRMRNRTDIRCIKPAVTVPILSTFSRMRVHFTYT